MGNPRNHRGQENDAYKIKPQRHCWKVNHGRNNWKWEKSKAL